MEKKKDGIGRGKDKVGRCGGEHRNEMREMTEVTVESDKEREGGEVGHTKTQ